MTTEEHAGGFDVRGVRADLLDCIQANLAVLADHHHGPGTHLNLGAALGFRWRTATDGLPTVDPTISDQLSCAERVLGLSVAERAVLPGGELLESLRAGGARFVVADGHELPWTPYYRHRHIEHSFLIAAAPGGWRVTDAYRNETQWGAAVPGSWQVDDADLAELASVEAVALVPTAPPSPAPSPEAGPIEFDGYLAAFDDCPDRALVLERLTAETWLLARSRRLHSAYRGHSRLPVEDGETEHLRRWDRLVEQTYVAWRRVARGRVEPSGVLDRLAEVLTADRAVFGRSGDAAPRRAYPDRAAPDALRRSVAGLVGEVLEVSEAELLEGADFASFVTFSSFRLVEIIERLESDLGVEIEADELVPENLHRVDDLCRIIRHDPASPSTNG